MLKLSYPLSIFLALGLMTKVSFAADTARGAELYVIHCATCHGATGISVMPDAPNFAQNESLVQPDISLLIAIKSGKNAMPAYQGILKDTDILDLIGYLRTLN